MLETDRNRPTEVTGPLGERMTRDDLPPRNTMRWIARRKAEVVAAVNGGLLTVREACERYDLTLEEFASWQRAVEREATPVMGAAPAPSASVTPAGPPGAPTIGTVSPGNTQITVNFTAAMACGALIAFQKPAQPSVIDSASTAEIGMRTTRLR